MNWSYCWRTKRRTEQEQQYLTVDPHSPPEFRANIVRNLDEFHEVFGTAAGDGLWLDPTTASGSGEPQFTTKVKPASANVPPESVVRTRKDPAAQDASGLLQTMTLSLIVVEASE